MIELNLALIATSIGIVASIWKFANSISKFGHSVDELRKSMDESKSDRLSLRRKGNVWESVIDNNSWSPEGYPQGWKEVK